MTICPRCHKTAQLDELQALSRRNNCTMICNSCGNEEAMNDYIPLRSMMPEQLHREVMFSLIGTKYFRWDIRTWLQEKIHREDEKREEMKRDMERENHD